MSGVVLLSQSTRPCQSMHGNAWTTSEQVIASIIYNILYGMSDVAFRNASPIGGPTCYMTVEHYSPNISECWTLVSFWNSYLLWNKIVNLLYKLTEYDITSYFRSEFMAKTPSKMPSLMTSTRISPEFLGNSVIQDHHILQRYRRQSVSEMRRI